MATLRELRARAAERHAVVHDDAQTPAIRIEAAKGRRWAPRLHELVYPYTEPRWRSEAVADALADVVDYDTEPCDDLGCDWCRE